MYVYVHAHTKRESATGAGIRLLGVVALERVCACMYVRTHMHEEGTSNGCRNKMVGCSSFRKGLRVYVFMYTYTRRGNKQGCRN